MGDGSGRECRPHSRGCQGKRWLGRWPRASPGGRYSEPRDRQRGNRHGQSGMIHTAGLGSPRSGTPGRPPAPAPRPVPSQPRGARPGAGPDARSWACVSAESRGPRPPGPLGAPEKFLGKNTPGSRSWGGEQPGAPRRPRPPRPPEALSVVLIGSRERGRGGAGRGGRGSAGGWGRGSPEPRNISHTLPCSPASLASVAHLPGP